MTHPARLARTHSDPSPAALVEGVRAGNRTLLARAITLVESRAPRHREQAREVLREILPHTGGSIRVGITGVPGAGKSTFIEALGLHLCNQLGLQVAVLAVDPSSSRSGGSILGDKTRMEELARHPKAFIRPSPSGNHSGGVAARTREALLLCEAAGFDVVLVETVGVGQGEIAVRGMTDFFLLLQIAGAGDDLQGIKKGVIEMADAIVVNKADGDNQRAARMARTEYARVLHFLQPFTPEWEPPALTCSALEGTGIEAIWSLITGFHQRFSESGYLTTRRREQSIEWFHSLLRGGILERFLRHHQQTVTDLEAAVAADQMPVAAAVEQLLDRISGGQ